MLPACNSWLPWPGVRCSAGLRRPAGSGWGAGGQRLPDPPRLQAPQQHTPQGLPAVAGGSRRWPATALPVSQPCVHMPHVRQGPPLRERARGLAPARQHAVPCSRAYGVCVDISSSSWLWVKILEGAVLDDLSEAPRGGAGGMQGQGTGAGGRFHWLQLHSSRSGAIAVRDSRPYHAKYAYHVGVSAGSVRGSAALVARHGPLDKAPSGTVFPPFSPFLLGPGSSSNHPAMMVSAGGGGAGLAGPPLLDRARRAAPRRLQSHPLAHRALPRAQTR